MLRREKIFVGATLVKAYVHEYKRRRAEVFVPLVYEPGDLAEVPQRVLYDNLRSAVSKVLLGSELTARFAALANHCLFEPCFARPETGHDKGRVEARGKGIRWQHLVPIPQGDSLSQMSVALLARLDADAKALPVSEAGIPPGWVDCDAEGGSTACAVMDVGPFRRRLL